MRFDAIDIKGTFKIRGTVGATGNAVGFSGSSIEWITVDSGPTNSTIRTSGYNYKFVGATGTDAENGQGLFDSIQYANSNWSGSPAADNRYTLFLMPGVYDVNNYAVSSYIDLVGISSDPHHTIIQNSIGDPSLDFSGSVDSALENLHLKNGPIIIGGIIYNRWNNIVVSNNTFDDTTYLPTILSGEFKNIVLENATNFAIANQISAKFKNIKGGTVSKIFYTTSGALSGIIEDVEIDEITSIGFASDNNELSGRFERIKVKEATTTKLFYSFNNLSGTFRNIEIGNVNTGKVFNSDLDINGKFSDIKIGNVSSGSAFESTTNVNGSFKNIKIDYVDNSSFTPITNLKISDIEIGEVRGDLFTNVNNTINVTAKNMVIGYVTGDCFASQRGGLYATFSNMKFGRINGNFIQCGDSSDDEMGIYMNGVELGRCDGNVIYSYGTHEVKLYNCDFGNIAGNLILSQTPLKYYSIFLRNSKFGNISQNVIKSNTSIAIIDGEIVNCEFGDIGGDFFTADITNIVYDNIKIGNLNTFLRAGAMTKIIKNVKLGNIQKAGTGYSAIGGGALPSIEITNIDNLTINSISGEAFIASSIDTYINNLTVNQTTGILLCGTFSYPNIRGIYKNIKIGSSTRDIFTTIFSGVTTGIYKNIEIGSARNVFKSVTMDRILVENLTVGTCSTIFENSSNITNKSKFRNVNVVGRWSSTNFAGNLENSVIDHRGRNFAITQPAADSVIKRSKILTNSANPINLSSGLQYLSSFNFTTNQQSTFTSSINFTDSDLI